MKTKYILYLNGFDNGINDINYIVTEDNKVIDKGKTAGFVEALNYCKEKYGDDFSVFSLTERDKANFKFEP